MSTTLRLELDGSWELTIHDLQSAALGVRDTRRLLADLGAMQVQSIGKRVDQRLGADGRTYSASKRATGDNGQTLRNRGHMMSNLGITSNNGGTVTIGWSSAAEIKKAIWANDGTKPHKITAKPGKALAFAGGSYQNAFRVASKKMGARYFSAGTYSASAAMRAGKSVTGMTIVQSVNHPGTPPRPFFGISMDEEQTLTDRAERWRDRTLEARSL